MNAAADNRTARARATRPRTRAFAPAGRLRARSSRSGSIDDAHELIRIVYEAAVDHTRWPSMLATLAHATESEAAALLELDARTRSGRMTLCAEIAAAWRQRYDEHFGSIDPFVAAAAAQAEMGRIESDDTLCAAEPLQTSRFFLEWMQPQGFAHLAGGALLVRDGRAVVLVLLRSPRRGALRGDRLELMQMLGPHLEQAMRVRVRLQGQNVACATLDAMLDRLPVGLVLLDERCAPVQMNQRAVAILAANDGLYVDGDVLHAAYPQETARLRALVAAAGQADVAKRSYPGGAIAVSRPSLRRPLSVLVAPVPGGAVLAGQSIVATLFIGDPEETVDLNREVLKALHGLTEAEAGLAVLLASGRSLEQAAKELSISLNTARSHLKRVFAKTETHGQPELMRLLLASPAILRSLPPVGVLPSEG